MKEKEEEEKKNQEKIEECGGVLALPIPVFVVVLLPGLRVCVVVVVNSDAGVSVRLVLNLASSRHKT